MWSFKKHFIYSTNTNLHEKIHLFDIPSNKQLLPTSFILKFQLGNQLHNKTLLYANRILIERLTGQKMIYVSTKKHHAAFNIAEGTQFGCLVTCRSTRMFLFFIYLTVYSLRNLNRYIVLTRKYNIKTLQNFVLSNISFGITKLLFFITLSLSKDWDKFSYIYDNAVYGVDFSIETLSNNIYINKLIFSHLGLTLI